jgi:ATP-dependent phosphofructokinase / diphosphate-dependent phosphofructokinase
MKEGCIGILVSGGPAPGINSVISACVNEADKRGVKVKGLKNGFKGITMNIPNSVVNLTPENVHGIYNTGGSILGTSRFNPFSREETAEDFLTSLESNNINKLIVIGGEGSAYVSYQVSKKFPDIKVMHVPKTIDNDLILPHHYPSFGFETARYVGTNILYTIMTDAITCQRWFLVTCMGRKAGFLALGLGVASGATLTLIPEEYIGKNPTPGDIAHEVFKTMEKSKSLGHEYGVVILAEGILDALDPNYSEELKNCQRDELGRIRYSMLELGDVIADPLIRICKQESLDIRINTKNIGYELRCHQPVSFDVEYTTFLGFGAVRLLMEDIHGVTVTRDFDKLGYEPLSNMILPDGTVRSRNVDVSSELYQISRSFMIR